MGAQQSPVCTSLRRAQSCPVCSPQAKPTRWSMEFLSLGGVLIQLCVVTLDHSVCSAQLFSDGGMSGQKFLIWLVLRMSPLADIYNHPCGDQLVESPSPPLSFNCTYAINDYSKTQWLCSHLRIITCMYADMHSSIVHLNLAQMYHRHFSYTAQQAKSMQRLCFYKVNEHHVWLNIFRHSFWLLKAWSKVGQCWATLYWEEN